MYSTEIGTARIDFTIEPIRKAMVEAEPLLHDHLSNLDPPLGHRVTLRPDLYGDIEDAGVLLCFVARCAGEMIGYCTVMYDYALHAPDEKHANVDAVYLDPDCRWGPLAGRFLSWIDSELAARGVVQVFHACPAGRDYGKVLARRSGYRMIQRVYTRRLGGEDGESREEHREGPGIR